MDKWIDSDDQNGVGEGPRRNYMEEEVDSPWKEADNSGYLGQLSIFVKKYSPIMTGIALFFVVLGGLKLIFSGGSAVDEDRLLAMEKKIKSLEEKYEKYDSMDNKVTRIWEQAKSFENFKDRFDRTEASMILRMDHLATNIDSIQKRLVGTAAHSTEPRPSKKTSSESTAKKSTKNRLIRYHTVAPQETLYGISLKYGIELDNLLEMNHLRKDTVIQPGQKVIVKK